MDKYRIKRRRADYRDDGRGIFFTLEEVGGRRGMELAASLADATSGDAGGKVEGTAAVDLFVLWLSASIVEDDGSRPLDSDEGRAIIAEWPLPVLTAAGQLAIDVNTPENFGKN